MKSDKNAKIYVAGHTGLVGSTILKKLIEKGYSNILLSIEKELDLRNQLDTEKFFEANRPEFVILAAAKVGGIVANNTYKADFIYDNLAIGLNVINCCYKYNVKKLLNLGSSCIYPKLAIQPIKEEYLLDGKLEPTNEPYAIAKIAAIKLCSSYNFQFGTNFISVMPTNLYGKNDNFNLETSHVMPALIRKIILAKALKNGEIEFITSDLKQHKLGFGIDEKISSFSLEEIQSSLSEIGISSDSVTIWGSGNVRREFLHVDDMAEACIYLKENYNADEIGEFVNIGTGTDVSIKELAEQIKELAEYDGNLIFDNKKPDGTPRKLLDVTKINNLGWKAQISLTDGIRKVISDYLKLK